MRVLTAVFDNGHRQFVNLLINVGHEGKRVR
jgi:hypothetical protein